MRISKQIYKQLPSQVADAICNLAGEYSNLKSFSLEDRPAAKSFVVGEGERYYGLQGLKTAQFETVSEAVIGASGLSYAINQKFEMPADSWLIIISYYGKYYMTVYHII